LIKVVWVVRRLRNLQVEKSLNTKLCVAPVSNEANFDDFELMIMASEGDELLRSFLQKNLYLCIRAKF
jgi:hypothetical protein